MANEKSMAVALEADFQAEAQDGGMLSVMSATTALMEDSDAPMLRYGFCIGDLALLVPQGIATEVLDKPRVFPLPRAPRWLAGMLNLRGNVVPLFKLSELPGLEPKPPVPDRILVLGNATQAAAVYVDDLPRPLTGKSTFYADDDLPPAFRPFVEPAFYDQGKNWFELNYRELLLHLSTDGRDEGGIAGR